MLFFYLGLGWRSQGVVVTRGGGVEGQGNILQTAGPAGNTERAGAVQWSL